MRTWRRGLILIVMIACCFCLDTRYLNDQYVRLKTNCVSRCQPKGYFQDLCVKLCMSPSCYHQIYQQSNTSKLEMGSVDTE
jgi:hypothetical protein